ncbi:hypothetical protein RFI_14759 [Reticulomyxa filosa]|uniref:Uncharacterized protein n=1 Tax=Reticulomyxa filosa TaxID=46433 RepID=X6NAV4_RETFI|nr:hypothetical protein RFI_14759 [Reticulomyxa filosa]|eukprot:ETO22442.1 hypothetical protein RFI_14759 [Reticulomyxa filosa]
MINSFLTNRKGNKKGKKNKKNQTALTAGKKMEEANGRLRNELSWTRKEKKNQYKIFNFFLLIQKLRDNKSEIETKKKKKREKEEQKMEEKEYIEIDEENKLERNQWELVNEKVNFTVQKDKKNEKRINNNKKLQKWFNGKYVSRDKCIIKVSTDCTYSQWNQKPQDVKNKSIMKYFGNRYGKIIKNISTLFENKQQKNRISWCSDDEVMLTFAEHFVDMAIDEHEKEKTELQNREKTKLQSKEKTKKEFEIITIAYLLIKPCTKYILQSKCKEKECPKTHGPLFKVDFVKNGDNNENEWKNKRQKIILPIIKQEYFEWWCENELKLNKRELKKRGKYVNRYGIAIKIKSTEGYNEMKEKNKFIKQFFQERYGPIVNTIWIDTSKIIRFIFKYPFADLIVNDYIKKNIDCQSRCNLKYYQIWKIHWDIISCCSSCFLKQDLHSLPFFCLHSQTIDFFPIGLFRCCHSDLLKHAKLLRLGLVFDQVVECYDQYFSSLLLPLDNHSKKEVDEQTIGSQPFDVKYWLALEKLKVLN